MIVQQVRIRCSGRSICFALATKDVDKASIAVNKLRHLVPSAGEAFPSMTCKINQDNTVDIFAIEGQFLRTGE